jgi:DNA recombination protein RmuC
VNALYAIAGIVVGLIIGWLWASARAGKQSQAEREQRLAAETRLEEAQQQLDAQRALLDEAQRRLSDTFKALASDALQANSQSFVDRAKQTIEPLQQALTQYEAHVREMEQSRRQDYGSLDAQVKSLLASEQQLQRETSALVNALRQPQARGRWGELTLRRVAELAGMSQYCDFEEQVSTEGGRLRPDMIVRLPAGRQVVVDAKCPLDAYLSALEATDEAGRRACLTRHCQHLRDHMNALALKSYWDQFADAPDFVVMFVPGESFLAAAMSEDPKLLEDGLQKRILVASPINLIALLHAVAYGWRQEQLAQNAQEISQQGRLLYERVRTFAGYFQDLGKQLDRAADSYNKAVGSLETRVLPTARRFRDLGAGSGEDVPALEPIDTQARQLTAPELTSDDSAGPAA